jgi:hypothetical protein
MNAKPKSLPDIATIIFQSLLTAGLPEALIHGTEHQLELDNSILLEKSDLSIFELWARWSHGKNDHEIVSMFELLLATGAIHNSHHDIYDLISDHQENYANLTLTIIRCLLSRQDIFPIKIYATTSSLAHLCQALESISKEDRARFEIMISLVLQAIRKLPDNERYLHYNTLGGAIQYDDPNEDALILPLLSIIRFRSLKLAWLLLSCVPIIELDIFYWGRSTCKPLMGKVRVGWHHVEEWIQNESIEDDQITCLVAHARNRLNEHIVHVFQELKLVLPTSLGQYIIEYLQNNSEVR